jgi:hypothetical protein
MLDGDGRLTQPVYLGTEGDYKELVTDSNGKTIDPWPFDNIPAAVSTTSVQGFASPLLPWKFITAAASPLNLAATDAGTAYECNTTSGNITFNLPSAATVGNGKGFTFKITSGSNTVILDPAGSQTIDGATQAVLYNLNDSTAIVSDGANWKKISSIITNNTWVAFSSVSSVTIPVPSDADSVAIEIADMTISAVSADLSLQYSVAGVAINSGYTRFGYVDDSAALVTGYVASTSSHLIKSAIASGNPKHVDISVKGIQSPRNKHIETMLSASGAAISYGLSYVSTNTGLVSGIVVSISTGTMSGSYKLTATK